MQESSSRRVEVKVCGLTSLEDARHALSCGADYLGFVLYEGSPRGIAAARMRDIVAALPRETRAVAVVVNAARREVEELVRGCPVWAVQLHGDESVGEFSGLGARLWRAVHIEDGGPCPRPGDWPARRYVLDSRRAGAYGGTGSTVDWAAAAAVAADWPVMLAGGLTPDNVAAGVRTVGPLGVDVASGVEMEPGRKDHAAVARFIAAARQAGA